MFFIFGKTFVTSICTVEDFARALDPHKREWSDEAAVVLTTAIEYLMAELIEVGSSVRRDGEDSPRAVRREQLVERFQLENRCVSSFWTPPPPPPTPWRKQTNNSKIISILSEFLCIETPEGVDDDDKQFPLESMFSHWQAIGNPDQNGEEPPLHEWVGVCFYLFVVGNNTDIVIRDTDADDFDQSLRFRFYSALNFRYWDAEGRNRLYLVYLEHYKRAIAEDLELKNLFWFVNDTFTDESIHTLAPRVTKYCLSAAKQSLAEICVGLAALDLPVLIVLEIAEYCESPKFRPILSDPTRWELAKLVKNSMER